MSRSRSWMLYGASGYTGTLIAEHAQELGHSPILAGRNAPVVTTLAEKLNLPHRLASLDDKGALDAALNDVDLVLNAAGPFLHTAGPLAEACLNAGVHYIDISNELQVFSTLYDLDQRARQAQISIIPGVGFGVVATNCLARYVGDAVGGAQNLEVGTKAASGQQGPGVLATRQDNLPYGGWIRRAGQLLPLELGSGITTVNFPDGPCQIMPIPTGDLEAAFRTTSAPNVTSYMALVDPSDPPNADETASGPPIFQSFGWARATGRGGTTAEAWLQTGDSYAFTPSASVRAVEETLRGTRSGALSPADAFGADFALTVEDTTRTDVIDIARDVVPTKR
jgi:short subunit dehydrogenase-like uncharacterized protein